MGTVLAILVTAILSSVLTGAVLYRLWETRLLPQLERQARLVAEEVTIDATERLRLQAVETGGELVPQFRTAIRDGIQDAVRNPPDLLSQTARGMTSAGVNVVEGSLRRIFGTPTGRGPDLDE